MGSYKKKLSVQISDIRFSPWTNTFGNRSIRLHCLRTQQSVKLCTPVLFTCSFIDSISWKISLSNYCRWIWSVWYLRSGDLRCCLKYVCTCFLNKYMYIKPHQQKSIFINEIHNHTRLSFFCFIKDLCILSPWSRYWTLIMLNLPFPRGPDIEPLSFWILICVACLCRQGAVSMLLLLQWA